MKLRLVLLFILPVFLAGIANAGEFSIGGERFSYSVPDSLVSLEDGKNEKEKRFFEIVKNHLGASSLSLLAAMIEREAYGDMLGSDQPPGEYLVIVHFSPIAQEVCNAADFKMLKEVIVESILPADEAEREKDGDASVSTNDDDAVWLHVIRDSETVFTAFWPILSKTEDGRTGKILLLSDISLLNGKIVMAHYYCPYETEQDVESGKHRALAALRELNIRLAE